MCRLGGNLVPVADPHRNAGWRPEAAMRADEREREAPGGFTDQLAEQFELERKAAVEHFVTEVRGLSLGRIGTPEEVARVIAFLLSPASAQITGSEYAVDGGALREV